jgi:hypothetical protein
MSGTQWADALASFAVWIGIPIRHPLSADGWPALRQTRITSTDANALK